MVMVRCKDGVGQSMRERERDPPHPTCHFMLPSDFPSTAAAAAALLSNLLRAPSGSLRPLGETVNINMERHYDIAVKAKQLW